ncbi:ABC transporter permease [Mobilitalea sibirica]|uniref:ABC transporter permease n=2 Tax=Mobilitalea sibirica TaxID=1462919 RepID=A0A8J7H114_9FIRM|nr:ABC transporter permease [Mobilitalea sibirica]MBH1939917.1 ABC transporter permease [Mobilitalea sibirica]
MIKINNIKLSIQKKLNRRQRTLVITIVAAIVLTSILVGGLLISDQRIATNFEQKNLSPSIEHPFGTDWLGRDMFVRTIKGLTLSIGVGTLSAVISAGIALTLGLLSATMGKWMDRFITWLVDLFLSVPHLITLILISFVLGGGMKGVIVGVSLTHWPSLTRIIRAEVMQIRSAEYVQISRKLGRTRKWVAIHHILPHLIPQFFVGLMLLFPHAILHEAAITFLGFGLSPHKPAIGIILSESMRYLSTGMWWLAFFPGIFLIMIIRGFDILGENLRLLVDPHNAHN